MSHPDPLLNKSAVADFLHCSTRTLERLVKNNEFPAPVRVGKEALWFESVVLKWLDLQRKAQLARLTRAETPTVPGGLHHPTLFATAQAPSRAAA